MNSSQPGSGWFGVRARSSAATLLLALATAPLVQGQSVSVDAGWRQVDLAQYRQHLQELESIVAGCQAQLALKRPVPSADNECDPNRVGQDDRVSGAVAGDSQPRDVRYDWLRTVLSRATNKTSAPAPDPIGLDSRREDFATHNRCPTGPGAHATEERREASGWPDPAQPKLQFPAAIAEENFVPARVQRGC